MDCGQGIGQATLVAYDEGLGTCCIGTGSLDGPREKRMRKLFKLPESAHLLVLMTVGYPLESREAGGQRPKLPFGQLYFVNEHGKSVRTRPEGSGGTRTRWHDSGAVLRYRTGRKSSNSCIVRWRSCPIPSLRRRLRSPKRPRQGLIRRIQEPANEDVRGAGR